MLFTKAGDEDSMWRSDLHGSGADLSTMTIPDVSCVTTADCPKGTMCILVFFGNLSSYCR